MLELSPGTHYVTKEARVLQIKGNISGGVQPVFSVLARFPLSPSSPLPSF